MQSLFFHNDTLYNMAKIVDLLEMCNGYLLLKAKLPLGNTALYTYTHGHTLTQNCLVKFDTVYVLVHPEHETN